MNIECVTIGRETCDEITSPESLCLSDGNLGVVNFVYIQNSCGESSNAQGLFCEDSGEPFTSEHENVHVVCKHHTDGSSLTVSPSTVTPGESFAVSPLQGESSLPDQIECILIDSVGNKVQQVTIDTSGKIELHLKNTFGSLEVNGCDNVSCLEEISYTYTFQNVGTTDADIILANRDLNGGIFSLIHFLPRNPLAPGTTTSVTKKKMIDVCKGEEYTVKLNADGATNTGKRCEANDELRFEIPGLMNKPSTPTMTDAASTSTMKEVTSTSTIPDITTVAATTKTSTFPTTSDGTCEILIGTECVISGGSADGLPCSAPTVGTEICEERPTSATMLFRGGTCEQSDNTQLLKFTCVDMNGGPPTNLGDPVHILVTDVKGNGIIYFDGMVEVGDTYPLNDNGERFEADQFITISTTDRGTVLQEVQYHSSCSQNLSLKDQFGANQLVSFFNEAQGNVTCFNTFDIALDIEVPIAVDNNSVTLTSLVATTSFDGAVNLTQQVNGQSVEPGGNAIVTYSFTTDASIRQLYTLMFSIGGVGNPDGTLCAGMSTIAFEAGHLPRETRPGIEGSDAESTNTSN